MMIMTHNWTNKLYLINANNACKFTREDSWNFNHATNGLFSLFQDG